MEFKETLLNLMISKNLTNAELSRSVGISKARISNFLNGVNCPSLTNAILLINFFHCEIDYLFGLKREFTFITSKRKYDQFKFLQNYIALLNTNHISNRQLSKEIGITKSCLLYWQNGKKPLITTLLKVVKKFNYSLDDLLEFERR